MLNEQLDPIRIDPDGIYEEGALRLLLGLSVQSLALARRSGALRHRRHGRTTLYLGQWVLDWLIRDSKPTEATP